MRVKEGIVLLKFITFESRRSQYKPKMCTKPDEKDEYSIHYSEKVSSYSLSRKGSGS